MITSAECKSRLVECQVLGTDPEIPMRRAVAVMAICQAWSNLVRTVTEYEILLNEEGNSRVRSKLT